MTKLRLAAAVACMALIAGSANAADLPSRKAAPVYVPPAPTFSWTGLYGGVNIGYGFGNGDQDQGGLGWLTVAGAFPAGWTLPNDLNGVLGGGQIGYNWQFNPWLVVGVEADIQAADLNFNSSGGAASGTVNPAVFQLVAVNQNKAVDWFGTVRGRIGVTPFIPNLLIYATGGFAYGQVVHTLSVSDTFTNGAAFGIPALGSGYYDNTNTGWTVGGGVEWFPLLSSPLFRSFSVKVEYLYTDLGTTNTVALPLTGTVAGATFVGSQISPTRFHTVRAGLNWHFNPFASAPVLAKY